jgi:hypothetical protein
MNNRRIARTAVPLTRSGTQARSIGDAHGREGLAGARLRGGNHTLVGCRPVVTCETATLEFALESGCPLNCQTFVCLLGFQSIGDAHNLDRDRRCARGHSGEEVAHVLLPVCREFVASGLVEPGAGDCCGGGGGVPLGAEGELALVAVWGGGAINPWISARSAALRSLTGRG